ncbi:hypothetical protein PVL96_24265 [Aeromonas hydrophila]|nr:MULTISPECIES: hypothetical protein [Aeromonas]MDD9228045.1 hypothetical protein [Aeromonas hydrophila]GJB98148.1 hypothetical protein KAM383_37280 [Aeromonas caviae]GJB98153.1 hypothetical protein KAM383_37330 [Aeromonas caviae]
MNVLKLTAAALGLAVAGCAATPTPSVSFVQAGDAATAVTVAGSECRISYNPARHASEQHLAAALDAEATKCAESLGASPDQTRSLVDQALASVKY